ncbi:uncharacterized protein LOC128677946 isoform X2 [Plodia interpunctella]|uniref:uncharacterized protein LOC128677946 isoform X2 n=1 Tax=Plodia interpunctella TaxID=58824 RepID=UPI0031011556
MHRRTSTMHWLNKQPAISKLIPEATFAYFQICLPNIINNVIAKQEYIGSSKIANHIKNIVNYNVTDGKHLRSSLTLHSYLTVADNVKEHDLYQACVLAWAADMVQACFIISDDIIDKATTRRGKPCWYLIPNVGMRAINDIMLIRNLIHEVLNVTFEDQSSVNDVGLLFNKAFLMTAIGQHLDNEASQITDRNYSHFTMETYERIIKYKTSYYSIQLPVLLGLYLAEKTDIKSHEYVESMCSDLALLYQMQDDYFDCFTEENQDIGKSNTDIQNAKCSWLAVKALQRCSPPQKIVFKSCYGSPEIAHIERIQQLYKKLQLPQIYKDEEKALYDRISQRAIASKDILTPKLFIDYLNVIYKRKL